MARHCAVIILLTCCLLAACTPTTSQPLLQTWQLSQLRSLDPADAQRSDLDLIAAYTRQVGDQQQIRLDFLDLPVEVNYDLYLALDNAPGGVTRLPIAAQSELTWDTLLVIPAHGEIQALDSNLQPRPGAAILVLRDPVMDDLQISFNSQLIEHPPANPLGYRLQVFVTPAGSSQVADRLGPVDSTATPPAFAPFLVIFWDSLPAFSPVQALRRWDGAHTGPQGGRHGLYNVLRTARSARIPLVLLDLKSPDSLAALEYVGGLGLVRSLSQQGLLELPQVSPGYAGELPAALPGWAQSLAVQESRQAGLAHGLPASLLLFDPLGMTPEAGSEALEIVPGQASHDPLTPVDVQRIGDQRLLAIPGFDHAEDMPEQATLDGPSLAVRKALLVAALSTNPGDLVVLGGDLPISTWGNPQNARASFRYLRAHPWMQALSVQDLLTLPVTNGKPASPPAAPQAATTVPVGLQNALSNELGQAAWQDLHALYDPVFPDPPQLGALRSNYLPQVQALLSAAQWASTRPVACDGDCQPQATCQADPDGDGQAECVLSSPDYYAIFELQGGYLAFAFARNSQSGAVHQWVAPSSQFSSGLSPAESWDLAKGAFGDPDVYPGAFFDWDATRQSPDGSLLYRAQVTPGELQLSTADGRRQKTFRFSPNGLSVELHSADATQTLLSLALDPWQRYVPGWPACYQSQARQNGTWRWSVGTPTPSGCDSSQSRFFVDMQSDNPYQKRTFLDSLPFMNQPEDPNRNYPPGHFLPFPLAVAQFDFREQISLHINWGLTQR